MNFRSGQKPTVEQWAELKQQGWTVEAWNAEMEGRARDNAANKRGAAIGTGLAAALCCAAPPLAVVLVPAAITTWLLSGGRNEL